MRLAHHPLDVPAPEYAPDIDAVVRAVVLTLALTVAPIAVLSFPVAAAALLVAFVAVTC